MNKRFRIALLIVIILLAAGYFIWHKMPMQNPVVSQSYKTVDTALNQRKDTNPKNYTDTPAIDTKQLSKTNNGNITQQNGTIKNWKTFTNERLGITFQYPNTWTKNGMDANVGDQSGNIVGLNISFIDIVSQSSLLLEYSFAPNGAELYNFALSQFNSSQGWYSKDAKQILVANKKAIMAFTTMSVNGKGNPINPPLRLILIDFLDKKQDGTIELQFRTPLPNSETEIAKLNQLLYTFKFTK